MSEFSVSTPVKNCARCGEDHPTLYFGSFERPCGEFKYWAKCPTTGDPILLAVKKVEND